MNSLERLHGKPQRPAPSDEIVGIGAGLDQEIAWRRSCFQITLQKPVLANGRKYFCIFRQDEGAASADAEGAAWNCFLGK
jgi:hypothetical protein